MTEETNVSSIEIRILGPIELEVDGRIEHIGGARPQSLVAALVLDVGHAVPVDRLIADVWGDDQPAAAETDLQSHISRLRAVLGQDRLRSGDGWYQLDVVPEAIDAVRFERMTLTAESLLPSDPRAALSAATQAMGLWRGEPFGVLGDLPFLQSTARRLVELRLSTIEIRVQAEIELGRTARAVPLLANLVEENPYRERLWYLLADGLTRDGRRVEALRALRRLERVLGDVGLEPSRELRELEQQIIDEVPPHVARLARHEGTAIGSTPDR